MEFWIFMLVINMLIPLMMIGFGKSFLHGAPKDINNIYGYRTAMSMKNRQTWEFAHHYFGRIWYIAGMILLPVSVLAMLPVLGKSTESVGDYGGNICLMQIIPLVVPIIPTEIMLRKKFDKNGIRKN